MKLNPNHPALHNKHTIHPKYVVSARNRNVLYSVKDNNKLGKGSDLILKGHWRGMPMYYLTLEERHTCPTSCHHWDDCFGNNMGFARRFQPGKYLEESIEKNINNLAHRHPNGFVVRLHILGDFYSVQYVRLWNRLMAIKQLHVFGYTARIKGPIADALKVIRMQYPERWWIRDSSNSTLFLGAHSIPSPISFPCPEQTGKTESCLTCGACWSTTKSVYFEAH